MSKSIYLQAPDRPTHVTQKGTIRVKEEDWSIVVNTRESSGEERELSLISISFHDGAKWEGTIQDLRAIQHYAASGLNALESAKRAEIHEFNESEGYNESLAELTELLSHFKK